MSSANNFDRYRHPYEAEISSARYPDRVYESAQPILYQPVDKTSATWVDTYEGVLDMLKELRKAKEIAIDLEHHDMRTYAGLLSLMQISTREKDWVVDTLKPWRHKLEVLNEVFADPTIVKVRIAIRRDESLALFPHADKSGISWRPHGHALATERPRSVRQRAFRHVLCLRRARISPAQSRVSAQEIRRFRCRQEISNGRLAHSVSSRTISRI